MASNTGQKFSAREQEILALAWQCFETEPKIDYKKFAQLAGYTEGSAKTIMGTLRRKLKDHAAGVAPSTPSTPKKKATAGATTPSKKRGPSNGLDGPDDLDGDESPTKKTKTPKAAKGRGKKATTDTDDEEFADATIKNAEVADIKKEFDDFLMKS
ncbi:uncharacterized protein EI97DRAFT_55601 [Westerdykella ornata]|uniref:Uncharacterized protein n=1 Tax=Westerdykella ornata TaxID=318751 RepID=A0A6A6JIM7_WESOR|nr:uncharacterized protein EI97DRAFT_55601 [Westerdykella ornata]KAF2275798.1 hypothetical protein EI97DRAFT_55601 [Westerdykella ornata]